MKYEIHLGQQIIATVKSLDEATKISKVFTGSYIVTTK